jgi:hypothetical protein
MRWEDSWSASGTRPTVDIDLLGMVNNDPSTIQSIIAEVCSTEIEPDGLTFSSKNGRVERITEAAEYQGVRARFEAHLGTARVPMQVDVGFGDVVFPGAEAVSLPLLLDFSPTRFLAYSRESVIAEKLHALVRLGSINSRMNDFFDLWFLSTNFDFAGETLARAIAATFEARWTTIPPEAAAFTPEFSASSDKQAQWASFRRRSRLEEAPESLGEVVSQIAGFLATLMRALACGSSFRRTWKPPGPWSGEP